MAVDELESEEFQDTEEQAASNTHEANHEEDEWAMLRAGQAAAAAIIAADEEAASASKESTETPGSDVHNSSHSEALVAVALAGRAIASGERGAELASEGDRDEIAAAETVNTSTTIDDTHKIGAQTLVGLEVSIKNSYCMIVQRCKNSI